MTEPNTSVWNYRVVRCPQTVDGVEMEAFSVFEVYYEPDGTQAGYIHASAPYGETIDELCGDIDMMRMAFDLPVMERSDLR